MISDDCLFSAFSDEFAISDGHWQFVSFSPPLRKFSLVRRSPPSVVIDLTGSSTHVSETTRGAQHGVSSNCQLYSVLAMNTIGGGSVSDIVAGANHVVAKCSAGESICITNMSLSSNRVHGALNKAALGMDIMMMICLGHHKYLK